MEKRLFRNENDKVIAGVSSGIATYMEVDVTIIRLLFVLSSIFLMGTGVLVYLIMWIVVPVNYDPKARFTKFNDYFKGTSPNDPNWSSTTFNEGGAGYTETSANFNEGGFKPASDPNYSFVKKNGDTGRTVGGLFLLVIGIYFLMNEFNIIPHWFSLGRLWPLIFVAIGISFIAKAKRKDVWEDWKNEQEQPEAPVDESTQTRNATQESNTTQL